MTSLEIIEDKKTRIVDKLSSAYSINLVSLEEYERLIEYSQKIETDKELKIFEKITAEYSVTKTDNESRTLPHNTIENHITILSSREISGPITHGNITNILGDTKIYLNDEDLINDETVLNIYVLLGDVKITIPDNVDVICNAFPILGDISVNKTTSKGNYKKLIIEGRVILGDIKIRRK